MNTLYCDFYYHHGDFSLAIKQALPMQGIIGITGPSGSGKTTFFRCLSGLTRPKKGIIAMGKHDWFNSEHNFNMAVKERAIGHVFQEGALFSHLNVEKNLAYGYQRLSSQGRRIGWDSVIQTLQLVPILKRPVTNLSGGERQRVALGRALLSSPRILLLDEPVSALDTDNKNTVLHLIKKLQDHFQLPILYISHALNELSKLADTLLYFDAGKALACGPINECLLHNDLPFKHTDDAFVLLDAKVDSHDAIYKLATLTCDGIMLYIPSAPLQRGQMLKLQIHARDVSLSLTRPDTSSILNIVPTRITAIERARNFPGQLLLTLHINNMTLLARISEKSADTLHCHPGQRLYAQIKSIAVEK